MAFKLQTIGLEGEFHGIADKRPGGRWSRNAVAMIDESASSFGVECQ